MHEIIRMKLDFRRLLPRDRLVTLLVYSIALFVLIINDQPHSQNIYSIGCHAHLDVAVTVEAIIFDLAIIIDIF